MNQLAKVLMQYNSISERQKNLNESLNHLSFNYPDLYLMLFEEIKKRELEYNDPCKITKWLSSSNSNCYAKLHEALLLVKSNNIRAKDKYLDVLKLMLLQVIEKGSNIKNVMKICCLIEKSPHLITIYENLKHLIQQVNQLNHINYMHSLKSLWNNNFKLTPISPIEQINNQSVLQGRLQQHTLVRPNMMQPTSLKPAQGLPYFNLTCSSKNHLEAIKTVNKNHLFPQTNNSTTIIYQGMDEAFSKWLHYLKLHKHQWFFNRLSYLEIECIDENNINMFMAKVNIKSIKKEAQKEICMATKTLRDRPKKFQYFLTALDLVVTPNELCEYLTYMQDILHYPIPNRHCVVGDQLQQDIVLIMEKSLNQVLENLAASRVLITNSLLGTCINKFLECSLLIIGNNQIFTKQQIEKTETLLKTLMDKVNRVSRE